MAAVGNRTASDRDEASDRGRRSDMGRKSSAAVGGGDATRDGRGGRAHTRREKMGKTPEKNK